MLSIGFGVSVLSFYLMQKRVEFALKNDLSTRGQDQSELIYQTIAHSSERAKLLSKSAEIIDFAYTFNKQSNNKNVISKPTSFIKLIT